MFVEHEERDIEATKRSIHTIAQRRKCKLAKSEWPTVCFKNPGGMLHGIVDCRN